MSEKRDNLQLKEYSGFEIMTCVRMKYTWALGCGVLTAMRMLVIT